MHAPSRPTAESVPPTAEWYYRHGDRIHGPLTFDDLKASFALGFLAPEDPICVRPRPVWVAAAEVLRGGGPSGRAMGGPAPTGARRDGGFTLLELLVVLAACVLLAAAALPAVASAREASRRSLCADRQRQVSAAIHAYHEVEGQFPTGIDYERDGRDCGVRTGRYPWTVALLPRLGFGAIADRINPASFGGGGPDTVTDPGTMKAYQTTIPVFQCPSDTHQRISLRTPHGHLWDSYTQSNVVACFSPHGFHVEPEADRPCLIRHRLDGGQATTDNPTVVSEDPLATLPGRSLFNFFGRARSLDSVTDGQSATAMLSEVVAGGVPATFGFVDVRGTWWSDQGVAYSHWHTPNDPRPDQQGGGSRQPSPKRGVPDVIVGRGGGPGCMTAARSRHPGGVNATFVDGAVHFIDEGIDPIVWTALGSIDGGEGQSDAVERR